MGNFISTPLPNKQDKLNLEVQSLRNYLTLLREELGFRQQDSAQAKSNGLSIKRVQFGKNSSGGNAAFVLLHDGSELYFDESKITGGVRYTERGSGSYFDLCDGGVI